MHTSANGNPTFPPITAEHFRSIVPHPAVSPLRTHENESGYLSVYRNERATRWFAKIRIAGKLTRLKGSAAALPHQAALHVAQWYANRYGPNWPAGIGHRLGAAHCTPKGFAYFWQSKALGGWCARVREWNRLTEITGRRRRGHTGDPFDTAANCQLRQHHWKQSGRILVFRTRADAEATVEEWARVRFVDNVALCQVAASPPAKRPQRRRLGREHRWWA